MNPPPPNPQSDPVIPTTLAVIIRVAMDAVPHHPDASAQEQDDRCHAAYDMIATLRPRDPLEAMLAARIAATQFHVMDDLRCAGDANLAHNLRLRYRRSATALARMQHDAERELTRMQAFPARQPATLSAPIPAPREKPAPVAAPPRATGGFVAPTAAEIAQLAAGVEARRDARSVPLAGAGTMQRPAAAVAPRPAIDPLAGPDGAALAQLMAEVAAVREAAASPADDLHQRLLAEAAARAAASATALAA